MKYLLLLLIIALTMPLQAQSEDTDFLKRLMEQEPDKFGALLSRPDKYEIQILYTRIDQEGPKKNFHTFSYGLDSNAYYYPASTVKMPTAFLALEKINRLQIKALDKDSPMIHEAARPPQTAARLDTTSSNHLPSIAQYIRKIFLVSDNDAYNRLYEFLGQEYLNRSLQEKGYTHSRIMISRHAATEIWPTVAAWIEQHAR